MSELSSLCEYILRREFGCKVSEVANVLMSRGRSSFLELCNYLKEMSNKELMESLAILIQNNVVYYTTKIIKKENKKDKIIELYTVHSEDILIRLRFPEIVNYLLQNYGALESRSVSIILKHGRSSFNTILNELEELFEIGKKKIMKK